MEVFKELHVQVVFNTVRDKKGRLIQGQAVFNTAKAEHLVKTCISKGVPIPRIFMSRDGTGCPTMINELDSHNYHSPLFTNESDLENYTKRCLDHLTKECITLESKLFLVKSGTTASVQTEEVDIALEDKADMQKGLDILADYEGWPNSGKAAESQKKKGVPLPSNTINLQCEHCGKEPGFYPHLKYYKYLGEQVLCDKCADKLQQEADVQTEIAMEEQALEEMQMKEAEGIYEPTPMEDDKETDNDNELPF